MGSLFGVGTSLGVCFGGLFLESKEREKLKSL